MSISGNFPYNAPIRAEKVVLPPAGQTITFDTALYEYESFLVDNLGTEDITVYLYTSLVDWSLVVVPVGMHMTINQDAIIKVFMQPGVAGSIVNYAFQGYKK